MISVPFRHMETRIVGTDRLLLTERCERVSSGAASRDGAYSHVLRNRLTDEFFIMVFVGDLQHPRDKIEKVEEGRAFEEYLSHKISGGECFQRMRDVFSPEQLARIVDM